MDFLFGTVLYTSKSLHDTDVLLCEQWSEHELETDGKIGEKI